MILEGLVTTLDAAGTLNVAPMGPIVPAALVSLTLRPFTSSQTYRNLKERPAGVFHITDDVLLLAQAALNRLPAEPETFPAECISGRVLAACCRWYEFEITSCDDSQERTRLEANIVHSGRRRDFSGFNRARHAVLEATILATRLHLLPESDVRSELSRWEPLVQKTAGEREESAWRLVTRYVDEWYARNGNMS
jgi:hypothetical protein